MTNDNNKIAGALEDILDGKIGRIHHVLVESHPLDVCVCGDYRKQHKDGVGACMCNGLGHGGAPACYRFELSSRHRADAP
jgi:hypothetical protein